MDENQRLLVIGLYINSALYLVGAFVAGIYSKNPFAWKLALLSLGISYFGYLSQILRWPSPIPATIVSLSVAVGVLAGVCLIIL